MDDADGGVRGLRAGPGPGLFETLRVHYGLGSPAERIDLGGSSSLNLLLGDGDRRYAVRVHRPSVTPERLAAIHHARGALLAGEVPCAPVVPTQRGAPWISLQGRLVEVGPYVDHDAVMDSWQRLEVGIALLARAHGLLRHVEVGEAGRRPRFANHLKPADVQARTAQGTARIRGWGPPLPRPAWPTPPTASPTWSRRPRPRWSPSCLGNSFMATSGTITSCSGVAGRCCWPTSTSWASGPASTTWASPCGAQASTWAAAPTRPRSFLACAAWWPGTTPRRTSPVRCRADRAAAGDSPPAAVVDRGLGGPPG